MPSIRYRARTNKAHARASAPRQPTSRHNTARVEEKRDEKEEEGSGRVKDRRGQGRGRGGERGKRG